MKKTALTLALAASAFMGFSGAAQAAQPDGWYAGGHSTHQTLKVAGESDSESFIGIFGGRKIGAMAYEAAFSQKNVDGVSFTILDMTTGMHLPLADKVDLVPKIGLRHSSASIGNASLSGTSLLVGAGVHYQLTDKVSTRVTVEYAPRAFGEKIKNTSVGVGLAYHF